MLARIAIFEDNDRLRESLAYLLKMNDYDVVGDYNQCNDAANIARVYKPDVVLMDIDMPGESGIRGVQLIKEAHPKTSVIMYTVFEDDDKLFQCLCAGANGYLLKKRPRQNSSMPFKKYWKEVHLCRPPLLKGTEDLPGPTR
ncbi:response regulator transcription factor [Paraflavitalea speifideaquila]|uniref:response regulator n=1 Tax=Paraflavitalea speifideaquila TaxID=3076558 RepID=UPI0028E94FFC|nr:response regulator transcription factor [Paraflavitalea speifideiaquila]